ncbi:MAG: hypothetical protein HGA87_06835, partial [Desulfobulbaceae bacterium]|nr:hypothetical protein [Desulfobulbaceae bacterium]
LATPKAPVDASVKIERNEAEIIVKTTKKPEKNNANQYLYYHIQDSKGRLKKYAVIEVYQEDVFHIYSDDYVSGDVLRIHYLGYTLEQTL